MLCALQETLSAECSAECKELLGSQPQALGSSEAETVSLRYRSMQVRHAQGNDGSL